MSRVFTTKSRIDEVRISLNAIIETKSEDTFKSHLRDVFLIKNEGVINGNINGNVFCVWIQEQGRGGATGIFYPVITGRLNALQTGTQIQLKTKMNVIGLLFVLVFSVGILSFPIIRAIREDIDMDYLIPRILINAVLAGLMLSLPFFVCYRTARIVKKYLLEKIII